MGLVSDAADLEHEQLGKGTRFPFLLSLLLSSGFPRVLPTLTLCSEGSALVSTPRPWRS